MGGAVIAALLIAWPFLSAATVLGLGRWLRYLRELEENIRQEPVLHPFWARPCRHRLFCPTADELDIEHLEFFHALTCPVAEELLANRRDAA